MTFIDVSDKGKVKFNRLSDVKNIIEKSDNLYIDIMRKKIENSGFNSLDESDWRLIFDYIEDKNSEIKIGRFIKKIFGDKYNKKQIEDFVNLYKSRIEKDEGEFNIVEGEDISYYYNGDNYSDTTGNLGNSCMRNVTTEVFNIYTENPEIVRMVILKKGDFIKGRALVWKMEDNDENSDAEFEYLMDRIYVNYDSDYYRFIKYAKDNDWAYKTYNGFDSPTAITYQGESEKIILNIEVKDLSYDTFPYMDTFKRYDPSKSRLYNDGSDISDYDDIVYEGDYFLEDSNGGYEIIHPNSVYSEYEGRHIDEDDSVYSERADSFLHIDRAIQIDNEWHPVDAYYIVQDYLRGEYLEEGDVIHSEILNDYVNQEYAVEVIIEVVENVNIDEYLDVGYKGYYDERDDEIYSTDDFFGEVWWETLSDYHNDYNDYNFISKDILIQNEHGDYILEEIAIFVLPVNETQNSVKLNKSPKYLSFHCANILKYSIEDKTQHRTIDMFTYLSELEELDDNILDVLKDELDKNDELNDMEIANAKIELKALEHIHKML